MAYTKTNWVNGTTPLNDKNMNKIENALENLDTNMNKIENALENLDTNISKSTDEYSSTRTYSIGELVIYNNKLYKANQDITTAEAFNSSHWTEVTLLSVVNAKQDKLIAGTNITISDNTIIAKDTTYSNATSSVDGLMSKADKTKLDELSNLKDNFIVHVQKLSNVSLNLAAHGGMSLQITADKIDGYTFISFLNVVGNGYGGVFAILDGYSEGTSANVFIQNTNNSPVNFDYYYIYSYGLYVRSKL